MTFYRLLLSLIVVVSSASYVLFQQKSKAEEIERQAASVPVRPAVPPSMSAMVVVPVLEAEVNQCQSIGLTNSSQRPIEVEFAKTPGLGFYSDADCSKAVDSKTIFAAGQKFYYFRSRVLSDQVLRFATSEGILFESRLLVRRYRTLERKFPKRPNDLVPQSGGALLDVVETEKQVCSVDREGSVACALKGSGALESFVKVDLPSTRIFDIDGDSDETVCAATDKGVHCWDSSRKPVLHTIDSSEAVLNVAVNDGKRICGLMESGKIGCEVNGTVFVLLERAKEIFQGLASSGSLAILGIDGKVKFVSDSNATDKAYCEVAGVNHPNEIVSRVGSSPCQSGCVRNSSELRCWTEARNRIASPQPTSEFL